MFYGYLKMEDKELWAKSADMLMNRGWWDYMADIMETHADSSPVCVDFIPMFHLN